MNKILENAKDFKIIPDKFVNATIFDIKKIEANNFIANLKELTEPQLSTYCAGNDVEIYGSSTDGLIYFTTKIVSKEGSELTLSLPSTHKNIQRREYSRITFNGDIELLEQKDFITKTIDISAGGTKFNSNSELTIGKEYPALIKLTNHLEIKCDIQVIRVYKENQNDADYTISARFKNIKSIDRIALVQYTFKAIIEEENKNND